jgi:hypothetical protein
MTTWIILGVALAIGVAWLFFSGFLKTFRTYRGARVVTCPADLTSAEVSVDALHAAQRQAISGESDLQLNRCSHWPEREACPQDCVAQIAASPKGTLVSTIVSDWYQGKHCVYCGHPIEKIVWHERPPAVRMGEHVTHQWVDIAPKDLPNVLAHGEPVCWSCHTHETFIHEHPVWVVERPRVDDPPPRVLEPTSSVY